MNELIENQLSGELETTSKEWRTIWINGESHQTEVRFCGKDDHNEYYEVYLRGEGCYGVSRKNFERIQEAICRGAKFVRINDDLVNVNEIRRFKKVR